MATFGFGSGSSSSNRNRKDRAKIQKKKHLRRSMLETLEVRNLMTTGPELIGVQPNEGSVLALGATSSPTVLNVSPRELVLRFANGAAIAPNSLSGIQIKRAGADGALSSAYLTTDLGTQGLAVLDFSASLPGQQGNGTELRFTQSFRTVGANGKPASFPLITVQGQRINIDVNIAPGFKTTANQLVQAMREDGAASALVVTSLLRGNGNTVISDTVPVNQVLTLIGADSARASTNFNSGSASLQVEFLSVNSASSGANVRMEFTSRPFDVPGPPNVLVSGQTIRVELNSDPRFLTTVNEVILAVNSSNEARQLVTARLVSGSPSTRIGGNNINYSPLILVGGDDQLVTPAYIGLGDTGREVVVRFGEALPDDSYLIDIIGSGPFALRDTAGFAFNGGVSQSVRFDLDLGPTIQAVVPQPVITTGGTRQQLRNVIYVYFNGDKLDSVEAVKPIHYQLIHTADTLFGGDDITIRPVSVNYDAALNRVALTFDRNLDALVDPANPGAGALPLAALRLRIGNDEVANNTAVTTFTPAADPADHFGGATDLGGAWLAGPGAKSAIVSSEIKNTDPYLLDFPGANNEPSNRNNRYQQHVTRVDTDGIEVIYYNFASALGSANQSVQLNAITEVQKTMVRQVVTMYERYFGARFVESDNQGFTIAVGDMQAINPLTALTPVESNRPGGLTFAAGPLLSNPSQSAVVIDSQDFNTANDNLFGSELFRSFMRGVGVLLGLGNADELPQSTIQNNNPINDPKVENVFPGNADIIHGQYIFRPEGRDIDLYRFTLPAQGGKLSLQIIAERQTDSSLLDAALRLYRNEGTSSAPRWVELAANDDYFSKDSRIELEFTSGGEYIVGVSAKGNTSYDPNIPDSGLGGRSEGVYQLRLDYRPPAASILTDADGQPTPIDGDGDGRPGGVFNYWFVPTRPDRAAAVPGTPDLSAYTVWVDKTATSGGNGTLATPFNTLSVALSQAASIASADTTGRRVVTVRVLGNTQQRAYEIGFNRFGQPLADGTSFDVPRNVNVMIDAGAIIKMGQSRISVGSSTVSVNRGGGALQLLGTPDSKVIVTSIHDTVGVGSNPDRTPPPARAGDWGGIDFRNRIDGSDQTRTDKERAGLFLNAVIHSDIRFGGGQVLVDGVSQVITPINIIDSRPTIANNTITRSADAAMSATPNSFREDDYRDARSQATGLFIPDYERIGPDIHGNRVVDNTVNGLFVRTQTGAAGSLETITVAARFNDVDIPYVLGENLVVAGTPGGGILDVASPPSTLVVLSPTSGGSLEAGIYNYRLVYVDANGNESLASTPTASLTVADGSAIALSGLPPISSTLPYVGRRLYRSERTGDGPYRFVAQINSSATTFVDNGTTTGGELVLLPAKIRPRLDGSLVIDPGAILKNRGSRIEVRDGGVLIAEGTSSLPIVMTSINDISYGSGGTFDTAGNRGSTPATPGDWGGVFVGHGSSGSLDYNRISFGGGTTRVEGGFSSFNAVEVHQADFRLANSRIEKNASGVLANIQDPSRVGRGTNDEAAIFVRGAQPIVVNNRISDNAGAALHIDVNSLNNTFIQDHGRSVGAIQPGGDDQDNQGPLVRRNQLSNNNVNGMVVRGQTLTTESVWDDTDIVHVVFDDIRVPEFHTYGGLRLESSDEASLVVKFLEEENSIAGLTATGRGQDIGDRIGGSVQLAGRPGSPVVLTSLNDCTVGAGFTVDGLPQVDTLNTGFCASLGDDETTALIADVIVVMDESASMLFAQQFSIDLIADLDRALVRAGVGASNSGGNLFGLVGYGDANSVPRSLPVGPNGELWGTSAEYAIAAGNLNDDGFEEDGYLAIEYALNNYTFRPNSERFILLVTNEDRDILDDTLTYTSTLNLLNQYDVKLQGVVNAIFGDANRDEALALDSDFIAYKADGQGGFTSSPGGLVLFADGTTQTDYIDLVFETGGIAGDIFQIQEGGITAASFSEVLVTSIVRQTGAQTANSGDWRGVLMETYSNDRNVATVLELEPANASATARNDIPGASQYLGQLAKSTESGDENTRLGFEIHGVINKPSDVDVYSFTAFGGTEVWLDIDRTAANLDTVVELISADGEILALSDDSYWEEIDPAANPLYSALSGNNVNPLRKSARNQFPQTSRGEPRDDFSTNPKDAGMRVTLPGQSSQATLYHVRVRSSNQFPGQPANTPALTDPRSVGQGRTRGTYQMQVRLRELQEVPGSSIDYADIRFARNGIELAGVPRHSPLVGETAERGGDPSNPIDNTDGPNNTFLGAQELGNLLQTDRKTISLAGNLSSASDVDWFTFTIDYPSLSTPLSEYLSTVFDIDYADGIGRADMSMYLFAPTPDGSSATLVRFGENSNILDDRHASIPSAGNSDLGRGSTGSLDPFIGPTELPAGRYYLALTNRTQVPTVLANRLNTALGNANVRILPVSSNRLIVEDRIGSDSRSTTVPPIYDQFLGLSSRIEYRLGDVPMYLSASSNPNGTDFYLGNSFTGQVPNDVGRNQFIMFDSFIRPNGDIRGFAFNGTGALPYVLTDPGTGAGRVAGGIDFGVRDLDGDNLEDSAAPMLVQASTVMPLADENFNFQEFGFLVANRVNTPQFQGENDGVVYLNNIVYRFNPNTGAGISFPALDGAFTQERDDVPDLLLGAGTTITERGFINTNSRQGAAVTGLAFTEATLANGTTQALINDGDRFTLVAVINGQTLTRTLEFNSGPELFLNFAPNATPARVLLDGDQFQIDGVTYEIETGNVPVPTPGVRTVFYNASMTNAQFAQAVRQAVPASIEIGFDGNRLNFSGATTGSFGTLVSRGVATTTAANGGVSGQAAINFLAQDTAETIAARVVQAIRNLQIPGVSAVQGGSGGLGQRANEVYLQGPARISSTTGSTQSIGAIAPNGSITGVAGVGNSLYAISNVGGLYRIPRGQLLSNTPGAIGSFVETSYELQGITFTGLTAGPRNVEGGLYDNVLFGTASNGRIYAFDTNGYLLPVFANGATSVATGIGGLDGVSFSNLDFNLWHQTDRRGTNVGHGVAADIEGNSPVDGRTSWYFGFENGARQDNVSFGPATDPLSQPRAFAEPLQNTYNFPGGGLGVLESEVISLAGISPADLPTLYFNYFLSSEQAASNGRPMSDSFRVYALGDSGSWVQLATNNDSEVATERLVDNVTAPVDPGTVPTEDVTNATIAWRQARVSLAQLAGNQQVRLRFEFSTAGGIGYNSFGGRGLEMRTVAGSVLRDGQTFSVGGRTFEIEMGTTLVFPSGAGIRNLETMNVDGTTFVFWDGTGAVPAGNVIRFALTDSPSQVANAALDAIRTATFPIQNINLTVNPEPATRNEILSRAVDMGVVAGTRTQVIANGAIGDILAGPNEDSETPRRDVDMFRMQLSAGTELNIRVSASDVGSTVNPRIRLFDAFGRELGRTTQNTALDVTLSVTVDQAGEYFIGISNTGINNYNPSVEEGRSSVGATGLYRMTLDVLPETIPSAVDNRLQLFGFGSVGLAGSSLIQRQGSRGLTGSENVPVSILQTMSASEVAARVSQVMERTLVGSVDQYSTLAHRDDFIDLTGYNVGNAGPFFVTGQRPGEENSEFGGAGRRPAFRAQNNAFEGLYLDDIMIGLAERGEFVTGATPDTSFVNVPSPGSEILVGSYQLEIRTGSDYGVPTRDNQIILNRAFDPNQALNNVVEIRFNGASRIADGDTITLNDGTNSVTLEFDDVSLPVGSPGRGVRPGNLAIPFNPISGESAAAIAARFRNAVNSSTVQSVLKIGALSSDGSSTGQNSTDVTLLGSVTVSMSPSIGFIFNRSPDVRFRASSQINDGDTLRIEDGMNSVTLEFDDSTLLPGDPGYDVATGNIAIPFDPTLNESPAQIATRVLAIINSPAVQSRVRVVATPVVGLGGQGSDAISINGAVGVSLSSNVGAVIPVFPTGDRNTPRDQGQVIIQNSRITDSASFGISITAGARDPISGAPSPGSVRNLITINNQRLIPGAVIVNNELVGNLSGGISIEGDTSTDPNQPLAPVPFARIVNNTIIGGRVSSVPVPVSTTIGGQFYASGAISFADSVVSYDPRAGGGPVPLAGLQDATQALGAPDYSSIGEPLPNQGVVSLGRGGVLVVRFDDNILTGSDDSSPDLAVYEVGNAELVRVEVSPDGVTYTSVGSASFNNPYIDLDRYGFTSLSQLLYVRLTDEPNEGGNTGNSVGADIDAVGAISSRPGVRYSPDGTGIRVGGNASPTLLNNILVNNLDGITVSPSSSSTVIGGSLYQGNVRNVSGAPVGQFPITVTNGTPMFTDIVARNLYPVPGAPSIDSSIDSLLDRSAMLAVKQPLGLAPSPIIAPAFDIYGALRVDDPTVIAPPGLGESIFKERGAADRSDFLGPIAIAINPLDNDATGRDTNPAAGTVELVSSSLQYFEIQLLDAAALNSVSQGSDIDPATVVASAVSVEKNGIPLIEGRDYRFAYDATSNIVRLTALSGLWESGAAYTIRFVNSKEQVIEAIAPDRLLDGSTYSVLDANGVPHFFEIETGIRLAIPVSVDGLTHSITDGTIFRIDDGTQQLTFEFDDDDITSTGNLPIAFLSQDLPTVMAERIVQAVRATSLNLTLQGYGNGRIQIFSSNDVRFLSEDSGINAVGATSTTPVYGLQIPTNAGLPQGIFDGQTFAIQNGGIVRTFEFDSAGSVIIGNIRVGIDTTSTANQAALIAEAINGSGLGVTAIAGADGYISVGANPSVRILSNSALQVVGVPGRATTTPIVIDLATVLNAAQVAEAIAASINAAGLSGVDAQVFGSRVVVDGALGLTGPGALRVTGIRDRAGNPMRATEANGDTLIQIFLGEGFDYGDAPDPIYASKRDSNGPRHKVVEGFSLGQTVTADPDARLVDQDLDDGVTFSPIIAGFTGSLQLTAQGITLARPGFVNVWIDFNGNGIFESVEKINIPGRIANGVNSPVTFNVPAGVKTGTPIAARIRFSSNELAIASPTGEAPDGEVEDYLITVSANPYTNPNNRFDVSGDGFVSPIDVLLVINYINSGLPPRPPIPPTSVPPYLDVNGDGFISPLDVLAVVNFINASSAGGGGGGEGEGGDAFGMSWIPANSVAAPLAASTQVSSVHGSEPSRSQVTAARFGSTAMLSLDHYLSGFGEQEVGPMMEVESIDWASIAEDQGPSESDGLLDSALEEFLSDLL
jgi:hypothetical protein